MWQGLVVGIHVLHIETDIFWVIDSLGIVVQEVRKECMGSSLIVKAESLIEPLLVRSAWCSRKANPPFAKNPGPIASLFQYFCDCDVI